MGFFTKLKKAWQSPEDVAQQALDQYKKEHGLEIEAEKEPVPESVSPEVEAPAAAPELVPETDAAPVPTEDWQTGLTLALRQAEPKLSEWLNIIVEGVDTAGPALWDRLAFLFKALGASENESNEFITHFEKWRSEERRVGHECRL